MDLRARFEQLAPRERLLVSAAAILALFALVVILAVRPLVASSRRAGELVADKQSLLAELERLAARLGPQSPVDAAAPGDNQPLVVLVDRTTRARGLGPFLKRNEPDGPASIRLRFENVPFDTLVEWMAELQTAHQVATVNASIDAGQDTGRVNCSLQLARALGS